jgi:hypothetical protein
MGTVWFMVKSGPGSGNMTSLVGSVVQLLSRFAMKMSGRDANETLGAVAFSAGRSWIEAQDWNTSVLPKGK